MFLVFELFLKALLWTHEFFFPQIWDHIFKTVFPKFFVLFSIPNSSMSRNMRKLRVKLRNATIYPPWGPIFKKYFFKNTLLPHLKCKTCSEGDIWKILRRRITDLKNQGPYKSQFCKKWVGALHFRENGLAITFTWPEEARYRLNTLL